MSVPPGKLTAPSKAAKLNAGTLIAAERDTSKTVRAAVDSSIAEASAQASRQERDSRIRQAALLAILALQSKHMTDRVHRALVDGRQNARKQGSRRLVLEMAALGYALAGQSGGVAGAIAARGWQLRHDEDDHHATAASAALGIAWRAMATHAVLKAVRTEEDPVRAIRGTLAPMSRRIDRTAVTETAQAYGDERRVMLVDLGVNDSAFASFASRHRLQRKWIALADACPKCWDHDGELTGVSDTFSGGDEPGFMHVSCRCTDELVSEADEAALAA